MGRQYRRRLILLLGCLVLTALPVLWQPAGRAAGSAPPLAAAIGVLPGWQVVRQHPLDPRVIAELQPDDYAFLSYSNGQAILSLYVGYYATADKVGAPHHPLVCFSGQGWQLTPIVREKLRLPDGQELSLASTTASLEVEKLYLTYWFQAHDMAVDSPFRQKLSLARAKFFDRHEDNAFVRVSVPMGDRSPAECRQLVEDFLQAFYPAFLSYIREQG
jgi:EpsI family protein